ncbi:cupin domain-containing protein [Rhodoplanes sp. TEM]|uniref:Cupin domain-containing protein n=1 Tax=Rhodoplanes tepidamans TaxID=200616 RepID=A0ABT5J4C3_RHOTP|nr:MULTISPECIES: cupin domain-containing protein [Rhodoplanes]MDC7784463.1 cupin domain-containing protein [Rhodoplanes tepidamans]MDC7983493.1 cupin domain-containing protein [Rhodoplanes sp. TEM]MDQ0356970.1 quercetin dioxygenase-like cupin family protein [Rhodoplanes tepidamans]
MTNQTPKPSDKPLVTKAGENEYVFDLTSIASLDVGRGYTSATGKVVQGERMMCGLVRLKAGEVTESHSHPNEQWTYIIEGVMHAEVDGRTFVAGPGTVIYQPSNVVHGGRAGPDADVVFFTVKDTSHGLYGTRAGKTSG